MLTQTQKTRTLYQNVQEQFNRAADILNLEPGIRNMLSTSNCELVVHFPVRLDSGEIKTFEGYRVQHNDALGPYKGGLRFHPDVDLDTVRALASWMTWKTSLLGLPYGGAKGGVVCDPSKYSINELERITRRFTYALGQNIGPEYDIPAPDINTNAQIMAWMADTYMSCQAQSLKNTNQHVVTGKPVDFGGLAGRDRATGFSVVTTLKHWAKLRKFNLKNKTYILQGFGNVGYWAAHFMKQNGAILTCVQDAFGTIKNANGIDPDDLLEFSKSNNNKISDYPQATEIDASTFFSQECDILIPAALGNQITKANAPDIKAFVVAEGANGPLSVEGERILLDRGISVIPDILCNAGGVTASYFEWLQNRNKQRRTLESVLAELEVFLNEASARVENTSKKYDVDLRTGAYLEAIKRIENAYKVRGIFP